MRSNQSTDLDYILRVEYEIIEPATSSVVKNHICVVHCNQGIIKTIPLNFCFR